MALGSHLSRILSRRRSFNFSRNLYFIQKSWHSTGGKNPFRRTIEIFKDDAISMKNLFVTNKVDLPERIPGFCDVLIIGGGVMGSSIAFWLKQRTFDGLEVIVVEKDPTYKENTSVLSVGGLRQQFSLKENIELSMNSAEFLRNIKHHLTVDGQDTPDIQFHPCGYLFLASEESAQILKDNVDLQLSLGAKVELLSPTKLKEQFPWMNTDGIALGSHGLENEGWFDPWLLLNAFKRKAIHLGAHYLPGEVYDFGYMSSTDMIMANEEDTPKQLTSARIKLNDGTEKDIEFSMAVIAGGHNTGKIGSLLGFGKGKDAFQLPIPIEPRKRFVYNVHCPDGPGLKCPLVIDPSGAYFRREGLSGNYLCGMSPPLNDKEPPTDNLDVDYDFFEQRVWPAIAARVPSFEKCKIKSAWAGYYDFNYFDENGIVGPHPAFPNLYLAAGFSGHGIQQSPAVGRAIMELLIDSKYMTVDLTRFEYKRYVQNEPLWESNIV